MAYRQGQISKYRNYKAAPLHQRFHIDNLHNIATTCPSESELIEANPDRVAVPLNKAGGKIAIFELSKPGRQVGGVIPALVHGTKVMDFMWDPFDNTRLVVGCDDGRLWVWNVPSTGLQESTNEPEYIMNAHSEKIYFVKFHPLASNVVATGSHDSTIRIWDLDKQAQMILIQIPSSFIQVYCFAWSPCGNLFAIGSKDGKVRIYEPRASVDPQLESPGPGGRGGRIVWVLDGKFLIAAGFDRSSERQLHMFSAKALEKICTISLDSSPTVLIPFYDEDSSVLLLSGRGDVTIFAFDVISQPPYIRQLSHHRCGGPHQGISFLKKVAVDVVGVEFAKGMRLTESAVEPWSFTVPRVKSDYFQEDLFPPTKCLWEPTMGSSEWFAGHNVRPKRVSLKPFHMKSTNILPETRWRAGRTDSVSKDIHPELPEEPSKFTSIDDHNVVPDPIPLEQVKSEEKGNMELQEEGKRFGQGNAESELESLKKPSIPEPLPRKKSLSSGSSSDELTDSAGRPVPRPRFKTNGVPMLRTPSSFLAKRLISNRSSSTDEEDSAINSNGLPSYAEATEMERKPPHYNNGNNNEVNTEPSSVIQGGNSYQSGNWNHNDISTESANGNNSNSVETSEVNPAHAEEVANEPATPIESPPSSQEEESEKQLTVAERMRVFNQTFAESATVVLNNELKKKKEVVLEEPSPASVNKGQGPEKEVRHVAPFMKPERKNTPPAQVTKTEDEKEPVRKRIETVFGQVSKYRNFKAAPLHKKFHIENLRTISTTCPGESELIQANSDRLAVPLNTPGGKLAIFEVDKPGRHPDGVIPALVHGTKVMDFRWDPFDNTRLAVGCDDGRICIWTIPDAGLVEQTNEPDYSIYAHSEKIFFVRFHPLAKDVLASGSYDLAIRIWDLDTKEARILIQLDNTQIQIFSFEWSPEGCRFASACKDGKVRIFEPRLSVDAQLEAQGPAGVRGGRVVWVHHGKFLVVAGFDRSSERQLHMYSTDDLTKVFTTSLDVSPAILVPFYDEDSSILFLSGRGDSTIFAFDVVEDPPSLRKLSDHRCAGAHQGISFLMKNEMDVRACEFAKAWRLTESAAEPWSFTVPRVKNEFFQDDLFPPTKCLWEPSMRSSEWFAGDNLKPRRVSLKPLNMKAVGEVNFSNTTNDIHGKGDVGHKNGTKTEDTPLILKDSKLSDSAAFQLEDAVKQKMVLNMKLEQDSMEGVDESEWTED